MKKFRELVIESVDEALRGVLGEGPKQAVLYHLEKNSSLKREEIPEKLELFSSGLERIFGPGTPVLTRMIIRTMCDKVGLTFQEKLDYGFKDYVEAVRQAWKIKHLEERKIKGTCLRGGRAYA